MIKQIGEPIFDKKIKSRNFLFEMSLREYFELTKEVLKNNEFQRNRVSSSINIYSRLREDLKNGCLIPSIVLALPNSILTEDDRVKEIETVLMDKKNDLIILDGLQRTYTIRDVVKDCNENPEIAYCLDETKLRVELYFDIQRSDILYRMLTLNTGHTQMSIRHQIEIVYSDLLKTIPNGVKVFKDTEKKEGIKLDEYKYSDLIDGFTSYLDTDYLPIDRTDILKSVKNLNEFTQNNANNSDLFYQFVDTYNQLVHKFDVLSQSWNVTDNNNWDNIIYDEDNPYPISNPYGKNIPHLFSKPQTISGFGAALGKLFELGEIKTFSQVSDKINTISDDDTRKCLNTINEHMQYISKYAKKIGSDQRFYFYCLFYFLFLNNNSISETISNAFTKYERESF